MEKNKVHIVLNDDELEKVDQMAAEDDRTRSALVGRLIRQEWARRIAATVPDEECQDAEWYAAQEQAV